MTPPLPRWALAAGDVPSAALARPPAAHPHTTHECDHEHARGAGVSPAVMAQGCAALFVGAGAPLLIPPTRYITSTDDALFFAFPEKELPSFLNRVNNRSRLTGEKLQ